MPQRMLRVLYRVLPFTSTSTEMTEVKYKYVYKWKRKSWIYLFAGIFFLYILTIYFNQQSEYKIFYRLMGWLGVQLADLLPWWGPLQRDLVHRITGQLATVFSEFVWRYFVGGVGLVGSNGILILYCGWYFCRGWLRVQPEYCGLCGSYHWWHTMALLSWMTSCTAGILRSL